MSKEARTPALSSGISPPLTVNVGTDHGGLIVIITSVCLSILLTSLGFRIYAWHIRHKIQNEDVSFTIMTVSPQLLCTARQVVC
jgi:hypothetical protein